MKQRPAPCYFPCPNRGSKICHTEECKEWRDWHAEQQERKEEIDKENYLNQGLWTIGKRKSRDKNGNIARLLHKTYREERRSE